MAPDLLVSRLGAVRVSPTESRANPPNLSGCVARVSAHECVPGLGRCREPGHTSLRRIWWLFRRRLLL
jgi:hypothetical protein